MEKKKENAYSIILPSGRKVVLREPKIFHRNLAAQAVGNSAGDSTFAFGLAWSQEMIRLIIVSIDGNAVTLRDRAELDSYFTAKEYAYLEKVNKMIGGEEEGPFAPKFEIVSIGST